MIYRLFFILLLAMMAPALPAQSYYVMVLGTAQDGGYPQAGCLKKCCLSTATGQRPQLVSSIAFIDSATGHQWLFDASPSFAQQHSLLTTATKRSSISGIFLTHAHIGHYTGLMHLGKEVMNTKEVPVYAMPRMKHFLETNGPWSQLVSLKNISLRPIQDSLSIQLTPAVSVMPFSVPHRDEYSETVGYQIRTANKKLVYIPDIDKWAQWSKNLQTLVQENDVLLIDGTFYKDGEINRPMNEVPHPFVTETMDLLKTLPGAQRNKIYFIHFNHTNPLLNPQSKEYKELKKAGYQIASQGLKISL